MAQGKVNREAVLRQRIRDAAKAERDAKRAERRVAHRAGVAFDPRNAGAIVGDGFEPGFKVRA